MAVLPAGTLDTQGTTIARKPPVAATVCEFTSSCIEAARKWIEPLNFDVRVFEATGAGGRNMETTIRDGLIAGALDVTTTELAAELIGGAGAAGKDRLTGAAIRGIPQVVSVGGLDLVQFGPAEPVPERFTNRRFYRCRPNLTLMRTTPEENDALGKEIAEKASAARRATAVLLPLRGISAIDKEGETFWWPEADQALFQSIRNWVGPSVQLIEFDLHINDPEFAAAAAKALLNMIR